jgi:CheY-like chemotaxis protein
MADILIADNQPELRQQLEKAGHRVAAVATISEAIGFLQAGIPDLMATDLVLTDGSSNNLVHGGATLGAKTLYDDRKSRPHRRV